MLQPSASLPERLRAFVLVCLELALILLIVRQFDVEAQKHFFPVLCVAAGGFVVHAWLPRRFRLGFFTLLSLASILFVLGWPNGAWVIGIGAGLIAVCRLPIPLWLRVVLLTAAGVQLAALRVQYPELSFWPVLGSLFMFRLIVYLFETRHERTRPPLGVTVAYFFPLPNVCFPLFPVLDFQTFRTTYYDRDEYEGYQTGVTWIVRGLSHLLLYRVIKYYLLPAPYEVRDAAHLALFLAANYALYLRVSGWFHLITGLLHLFGFNLPRTHENYFLASSLSDIWRRINIYWKDFMAKVFFFPAFFALRRWGTRVALTGASLGVFAATWLLHSYQMFWLAGDLPILTNDVILWMAAGTLVTFNIHLEARRARKSVSATCKPTGGVPWAVAAAIRAWRILGVFALVSFFWACWTIPGFVKYIQLPSLSAGQVAAGFAGVVGILVVAAAVGVLAQLAHDSRRWAVPTLINGQSWFHRSVAAHIAVLGLTLVTAMPSVAGLFGTRAAEMAASLRLDMFTPAEAGPVVRGYYEEIAEQHVQAGAFLGRLQGHTPPPDFGHYAEATRPTDDPLLGHELIPNWHGKLAFAPASINSLGLRDRDGITIAKPAHTCRIALVGTSVVMGVGVEDNEVFKCLLEVKLNSGRAADQPRYELLNFGRGRTFSINHLRLIERRVFNFTPDAIYYFAHQDELYTPAKFMAAIVYYKYPLPYPFMADVIGEAGVTADMPAETMERKFMPFGKEVTLGLYRELVAQCGRRGVLPVWVYLPMPGIRQTPKGANAIVSVAREAGFQVIDLSDWSAGYAPADLKLGGADYHPNALGHRLIAERLFAEFQKRPELLPAAITGR